MRTSTNINRVHCVPLFCCVYMYFRYLILLLILWRTTCNKGINNRHIQMNDDKWLLQRIEHSHNTYTLPPWRILIGYIVFRSFAVQVAFVLAFQLAENYMQKQNDENSYHTRKRNQWFNLPINSFSREAGYIFAGGHRCQRCTFEIWVERWINNESTAYLHANHI